MKQAEPIVDLRSDTVTRPSARMREAMASAVVGDDVYGDDPTVRQLEESVADVAGKEAGLFLPSGTQSNLVALMSHCGRGDEYIVGADAHCFRFEAGGAAVLGSIQPQPLTLKGDGSFDLSELKAVIKPDDAHFARTRLIALENTYHGRVVPQTHVLEVARIAAARKLALHLDGARAWNAAAASACSLEELLAPFDSASLCMSKGLGAPVGSVLVGTRDFVSRAHRWRKMVGGGMRQAGVIAAGALIALEQREGLSADHARALKLTERLSQIEGVDVDSARTETNMVFVAVPGMKAGRLGSLFSERRILISPNAVWTRLVVHRDIDDQGVDRVVEAFAAAASAHA